MDKKLLIKNTMNLNTRIITIAKYSNLTNLQNELSTFIPFNPFSTLSHRSSKRNVAITDYHLEFSFRDPRAVYNLLLIESPVNLDDH